MAKFCIFCGNPPDKKNKEHVIPQWLSKYTGKFHSVCELGNVTDRSITFSALTFPACTACNEKFASLEAQAKDILFKIRDNKGLTAMEINVFLDWMDKIRVGLWLGQLTLANEVDEIDPKFHIADRVGRKDRFLMVERINTTGRGIGLAGISSKLFSEAPSVFQIAIDDLLFTNASEYGLVSNRLGFPQFQKMEYVDRDHHLLTITKGREKTTHPVVWNYQASPQRTLIYQPMYKDIDKVDDENLFKTKYVMEHSIDTENGIGGIFYQRKDNTVRYLGPDEKINIAPKELIDANLIAAALPVYELQNYVIRSAYKLDTMEKKQREYIEYMMMANELSVARTAIAHGIKRR